MHDTSAAPVFANPDSYATPLIALALDRFGSECINWTPQTWIAEIADHCGIDLPVRNLDRIMGGIALLTRPDDYFGSASGFNDITEALAAEWFDPNVWHPPTTAECLWSIAESYLLSPPEKQQPQPRYSDEVCGYVTRIAREEGFPKLPKSFLSFGIRPDESVPPAHDYSSDPDLFAASEEGIRSSESDLDSWLMDKLVELAEQLRSLPLSGRNQNQVADEILKSLHQR